MSDRDPEDTEDDTEDNDKPILVNIIEAVVDLSIDAGVAILSVFFPE